MTVLIIGLVIFMGVHSIRIFAEDWRTTQRARMGEAAWMGAHSLLSLLGFGLIIWGFGMARAETVVLWSPPIFLRHIASLILLLAFILLAATYVPRNGIKARLHHPMLIAVKLWAFAHLLTNGRLASVVLSGTFLVWAVLALRAARKRDAHARIAHAGAVAMPATTTGTLVTVVLGVIGWAVFAFWLHRWLIGIAPFGAMRG